MHIEHGSSFWNIDIAKIEKYYGANYVGDFPVYERGNFHPVPASVFYRPKEKVTINNPAYFGMWKPDPHGYFSVFDAGYIIEYIFNGLQLDETIIYSRFKEDIRRFDLEDKNSPWISGGWEECNVGGDMTAASKVRLQVVDGIINVLPPKVAKSA